jgi:hypothetical protein
VAPTCFATASGASNRSLTTTSAAPAWLRAQGDGQRLGEYGPAQVEAGRQGPYLVRGYDEPLGKPALDVRHPGGAAQIARLPADVPLAAHAFRADAARGGRVDRHRRADRRAVRAGARVATPQRLESAITDSTRWVILNAPNNPTGAAYSTDGLRALADVLLAHPHVQVLTDEIYDEIWYEPGLPPTLVGVEPRLADRVFLTNGVSKTYAMTGWRIGYGAGPAELVGAVNTLQSQISSCPSSISQAAATAALTGDQGFIRDCVAVYQDRRDRTVKLLTDIPGLTCTPATTSCCRSPSPTPARATSSWWRPASSPRPVPSATCSPTPVWPRASAA